jgi:hypothetical protein
MRMHPFGQRFTRVVCPMALFSGKRADGLPRGGRLGWRVRLPLSAVGRGAMRAHVARTRIARSKVGFIRAPRGAHVARVRRLRRLEPDFGFKLDSSSSACRAIPPFTCPAFFLSAASRSWIRVPPHGEGGLLVFGEKCRRRGEFEALGSGVPPPLVGGGPSKRNERASGTFGQKPAVVCRFLAPARAAQ